MPMAHHDLAVVLSCSTVLPCSLSCFGPLVPALAGFELVGAFAENADGVPVGSHDS